MILERHNWHLAYEQIQKDCLPDGNGERGKRSVLLLCNADVDAMSSARILSYMLRADSISYQLLPCTCYSDLTQQLSSVSLEDISSIILFNFGASKNLTTLYDDNEEDDDDNDEN